QDRSILAANLQEHVRLIDLPAHAQSSIEASERDRRDEQFPLPDGEIEDDASTPASVTMLPVPLRIRNQIGALARDVDARAIGQSDAVRILGGLLHPGAQSELVLVHGARLAERSVLGEHAVTGRLPATETAIAELAGAETGIE